jgi:hypothetical protein
MVNGHEGLDPLCDADCITAKRVGIHALFEQSNPRPTDSVALPGFPPVELSQRVVHGVRRTIEVAALGLLSNARHHGVDERIEIGAALASDDDIQRDGNGAFDLGENLPELAAKVGRVRRVS